MAAGKHSPACDSLEQSPQQLVAVAALAVVWLVLMTYHLGGRSLHVDEYLTAYRIDLGMEHRTSMHPPTYYKYVRIWTDAVGATDAGLRSSNLIPAAAAVVCAGAVAWWLLPWPACLVALALVCLSAELLLYWRMARYFACAAGAYGLVMAGGLGYLREKKASWAAVMAAGSVLAAFTNYVAAAGAAVIWAWVVGHELRTGRRRAVAVLAALGACSAVAAAPAIAWAARSARRVMQVAMMVYPPKAYLLALALALWSLLAGECLPPWQPWVAFPAVAASGMFLGLGAAEAWRRGTQWRLVVTAWPVAVVLAMALVMLVSHEPPVRVASLALYALPYALLVMALGWHVAWPRLWGKLATAALAAGWIVGLANYFGMRNHRNPQYAMDWRQVAGYIAQRAAEEDHIITFYDAGFHRYYTGPGVQADVQSMQQKQARAALDALADGHSVWVIVRDRGSVQANQVAQAFIRAARRLSARDEQKVFFRYSPAERAWRRLLHARQADGYVTVHRLWLPQQPTDS